MKNKMNEYTDRQIIIDAIKETEKILKFPVGHHCQYRSVIQSIHDRLAKFIKDYPSKEEESN
jgi:hypothetical protein